MTIFIIIRVIQTKQKKIFFSEIENIFPQLLIFQQEKNTKQKHDNPTFF